MDTLYLHIYLAVFAIGKCSLYYTVLDISILTKHVHVTDFTQTFNNFALRVCLASFDDFIGSRVQLKRVWFAAIAGHLTDLDILQRDDTFWFFVL